MQINGRLRIVERSDQSIQFGIGAESLILDGLTQSDRRLIAALRCPVDPDHLDRIATECGLSRERAQYLVGVLSPVLTHTEPPGPEISGLRTDRLGDDVLQWSVAYERDAASVLDRRARCVVRVVGLGRTGSAIAQLLASAGVGTLLIEDDSVVRPADVAAGAYRLCDVGLARTAAVRRQIHHVDPTVRAHPLRGPADRPNDPAYFAVDLVILVAQDRPDPALLAQLMAQDHPHLPVLLREADTQIGPLVIPGRTACLGCAERSQPAADAPQFLPRAGAAEPAACSAEESSLAAASAGMAVLQSLLYLDDVRRPSVWSAALTLRAANGGYSERSYRAHPDCDCMAQQWEHQTGLASASPA